MAAISSLRSSASSGARLDTPAAIVADDAVEDIDELLRAEHAAAWSRVGPQPFLQSGDDDDIPFPAEGGVRAHHRDAVDVGWRVAGRRQRAQRAHVLDEATQ